jgi:RNA polymerase sigma-70 factor (ECF subfamily)
MDRDAELAAVRGLRAGEVEAFDVIYAAFNTRLFTFLLRLSRRRDVAEDLLEETWLRLVAHARRLRPDTRLAPWLFTVARNLHASYRRSRLLEDLRAGDFLALWSSFESRGESPFEAAATNELERRIELALAELPPSHREVLLLVGVEGFSPAEAAGICGITPEAMRQRLSRARSQLAHRLKGVALPVRLKLGEVTP